MRARCAVDQLAAQPVIFDLLRWILEAGFRGEKRVLRSEGVLDSATVLDVGCGTGTLSAMFEPSSYVGVDLNCRYIERARTKHPRHRFLVMDGTDLTLPSGSFDVVIISGVIHHLTDEDSKSVLTEARRVLNPGTGRLIMWEDVPTRRTFNLPGRLVHWLDQGDHIRADAHYIKLVQAVFPHVRYYPMSSGVCDYIVLIAGEAEVSARESSARRVKV